MSFILSFITNTLTLTAIIYHTYAHYRLKVEKDDKDKIVLHSKYTQRQRPSQSKNYPYVFILMSLLLAFEQSFYYFVRILPFYNIFKLVIIGMVCLPGTNMANRIYKEYVYQLFEVNRSNFDDMLVKVCDEMSSWGGHLHNSTFNMFVRANEIKGIEFKKIDNENNENEGCGENNKEMSE